MPSLPPSVEASIERAGLTGIAARILDGERLTHEDGVRLFESRALPAVGALANFVRERRHGDATYFVRNMHLNPTNVCIVDCKFCGFFRPYAERERGWTLSLEQCFRKIRERADEPLTEVHIVGGHNPDLPYEFYLDLLRGIRDIRPDLHIKAFTCAEFEFFATRFRKPVEEVFSDFREAGLGSLPGGGAEVLSERVRQELYPKKISAEEWLDVARTAHRMGLKSTATMLYGHVESIDDRVLHFVRLRELQDETGGFLCFIPLAFHPANTGLEHLPGPTGLDDLMTIAVARLMLDNFDHIKAYWIMITPRVAQVALSFGADDLDGTVVEEKIVHMAGARTPNALSVPELVGLIREAGRIPIQRDSLYSVVHRFEPEAALPRA